MYVDTFNFELHKDAWCVEESSCVYLNIFVLNALNKQLTIQKYYRTVNWLDILTKSINIGQHGENVKHSQIILTDKSVNTVFVVTPAGFFTKHVVNVSC